MLMNQIETALVNSPPRRWLQRLYETPALIRLGGRLPPGSRTLEIGCGSGYGTQLILDQFGAAHVDAIDLDPAMIDPARRRLIRHRHRVRVTRGSATDLREAVDADDGTYDAVFDFGILHIGDWRAGVTEVARVLIPDGRFYFEEVTAAALGSRTYRLLFDHPKPDRFTAEQFLAELDRHGLRVADRFVTLRGGRYLLGVAHRTSRGDGYGSELVTLSIARIFVVYCSAARRHPGVTAEHDWREVCDALVRGGYGVGRRRADGGVAAAATHRVR